MSMIEYTPVSTFRSPTIVNGVLPTKIGIAGRVAHVQSGTPLKPTDEGWVPATDGLGEFVSATGASGGDIIDGFRMATVDFHREPAYGRPYFKLGRRYSIKDVDDNGMPEFELDAEGPYLSVSRTAMLMDMTVSAMYLHALESERANGLSPSTGA
jgi:hypothetical protein